MLLSRGKLSSCPSSLLPPRLLSCPVALVVFGCLYFCRLGPALKYAVKFIVRLSAVLPNFILLLLAGLVLMKGHFYQELTLINSFTWLWPRIYVGIFVGWGRL